MKGKDIKIWKFVLLLFVSGILLVTVNCNDKNDNELINKVDDIPTGIFEVSSAGILMRNNQEFRGIGVNYYDSFYRRMQNYNDTSYIAGFQYLSENKIPFIRFTANGYWPNDLKLYQTNKAQYFKMLDEFVKAAERYGIGLIPSLFWANFAIPDLMGEHLNQWGNPNSKSIAFMREYTKDIVSRYKYSPAIWAWEFGNEWTALVDLLDQSQYHLPVVNVSKGTPATRSVMDAFTTDFFCAAFNVFITTVRQQDSKRAVFTGNTMPYNNMYHRYQYKTWLIDSTSDFAAILGLHNPSGTVTVHLYPDQEKGRFSNAPGATIYTIIEEAMAAAQQLKQPLFVGEFGASRTLGAEAEAQRFSELKNSVVANKVQVAALWVFDFKWMDADWNVTPTNSRKYQLEEIININGHYRDEGFQ